MSRLRHALIAGSAFLALSCASDSQDYPGPSCDEGQCDEVNGQDALQFYEQFLYSANQDGEYVWHRYLSDYSQTLALPIIDSEVCREVALNLFLLEDRSFILEYEEHVPAEGSTSCDNYEDVIHNRHEGTWSVDGIQLVLGDIGRATGLTFNEYPAIRMSFDRDLASPGLQGQQILLDQIRSSWGLDECSGVSADPSRCPIDLP